MIGSTQTGDAIPSRLVIDQRPRPACHRSSQSSVIPVRHPECNDEQLAKLEVARMNLEQCKTVPEAKHALDAVAAAKVYCKRQHTSQEIIQLATSLEIDAKTRLGEILEQTPMNMGTAGRVIGPGRGNKNGGDVVEPPFTAPMPSTLKELGLSKRDSSDAQFLARLKRDDWELHESVRASSMTLSQARRQLITEETKIRLDSIAAITPQEPEGKFDVVVIDPPWPVEKIPQNSNSHESKHLDYPTMSLEEIVDKNLVEKFAAEDCHVFLWVTQKLLPEGFRILEKWGVKYSFTMTWHKDRGMQLCGLPEYNSEFCVYGRVGSPIYTETKDFSTCFNAKWTGHSKKPEEFYAMIRRVTAGRRLDCYNRRKIEGFIGWGNQAEGTNQDN